MTNRSRFFHSWTHQLILALALFLTASVASALDYQQRESIKQIMENKLIIDGIPGATIAIVEDGKLSWSHHFGMSNVETNSKVSDETLFRSGSLVKPLTATAVLQLADRGKLELDAPVSKYCKEYPKKSWEVTTRHLLSHTAGVRSYKMPWSEFERELYSTAQYNSITEALSIFKDDPLESEPGSQYKYSSYGYNLLGCVIEGASGMNYIDYLQAHILIPADMKQTRPDNALSVIPGRASGYKRNKKGRLVNEKPVNLSNKIPSGGLITTAEDMAHFASHYMNESLLPASRMKQAMTRSVLNDGSDIRYGLGWEVTADSDLIEDPDYMVYHGGVTPGVSAILSLYPNRKSAIVIMMNLYIVDGREALVESIANVVHTSDYELRTPRITSSSVYTD